MMGIKTKIEWADSTVNPIMGCTGCALRKNHCYAAVLCARYAGCKGWPESFDCPEFFLGRLEKAIKWPDLTGTIRAKDKMRFDGSPRHIFVNDLSDGFCPDVDPREWLAPSIPAMHLSPHVWLLLTKWPDRMRGFFEEWGKPIPSNFRLGVSVENSDYLWRVEELMKCSAAVRFVSLEPLLGPIDLQYWLDYDPAAGSAPGIDWVIVGGESGSGARPMHPDWARGIRDQCVAVGVPFFFKQWGAWLHESQTTAQQREEMHHKLKRFSSHKWPDGSYSWRVGKKYAGRLLDGQEWNQMPIL